MTADGREERSLALLAAVILLCLAGAAQEICLLSGRPMIGILFVAPTVILCYVLWRPRGLTLAALLGLFSIQALLPLHTGGGRVEDWLLHYEISRHYGGLSSPVTQTFLASRTALFQQLLGSLLAHNSTFWAYQMGAGLLEGLWLWPAEILLKHLDRGPERILALALTPLLIAYATYTWPWCFAAFFLLAALSFAERPGVVGSVGLGVALGGALLAHPGSVGYVLGAGLWVAVRQPRRVPAAFAAGTAILVTQVPWLLSITGGGGILKLLSSTDPIRQRVSPMVWAVTRVLVAAHTIVPFDPLVPQAPWADAVLVFFVASIPGALLVTWLAAGQVGRPANASLWAMYLGFALGWAIDPPQQALAGMLDALFLGVLLLLVAAVAQTPSRFLGRLVGAQAASAGIFIGALMVVAASSAGGDANLALKQRYGVVFLLERFGAMPGGLLLFAAAVVAARTLLQTGDGYSHPARDAA